MEKFTALFVLSCRKAVQCFVMVTAESVRVDFILI